MIITAAYAYCVAELSDVYNKVKFSEYIQHTHYITILRPLKRYLCQWGFTPDRSDELSLQQVMKYIHLAKNLNLPFYTGRCSASSRRVLGWLDERVEVE